MLELELKTTRTAFEQVAAAAKRLVPTFADQDDSGSGVVDYDWKRKM